MRRLFPRLSLVVVVAALAALTAGTGAAQAAQTFTVTNTSDSGVLGDGSLRGEVLAANASPGADTIIFVPGLAGTITLGASGLQIHDPVDIEGPGPSLLTVAQSTEKRVVEIDLDEAGPVTIAGLHLANGNTTGPGGNLHFDYNESEASGLTIANCLITNGTAGGYGGGFSSYGAALVLLSTTVSGNQADGGGAAWIGGEGDGGSTVENSTFTENTANSSDGGALILESSNEALKISGSTFSGNHSGDRAGAVETSVSDGSLTISNSTFTGNVSAEDGGGALNLGGSKSPTLVQDSTISGNRSTGSGAGGGGIATDIPAQLEDTIVAGNTSTGKGADLEGDFQSAFSLLGTTADATVTESVPGSTLVGVDPQLGPLQNNGGPTETMALPPTSPAVNKGGGALTIDQRSSPRPVLYPGIPNSAAAGANGADIGAYELQAPPPPSNLFRFGKVKLNKKKGTATVSVVVPGAGIVNLAGSKKVKKASRTASAASTVKLVVKAKGKSLKALKKKGKVKIKAKFTFTPAGGTAASQTKKIKLVKKPA